MRLLERIKTLGKSLKLEIKVYRLVLKDSRTPFIPKLILGLAIGYALMPSISYRISYL